MKFGVYLPTTGELADPSALAEFASMAEAAGWDGFFIWDHVVAWHEPRLPVVDTTVALAAISVATERLIVGPIVTPLARRRPAKVAREFASLDRLSDGRMILGVGLGGGQAEWEDLGDEPDPRTRAGMLDEMLDLVTDLWTGEPVAHRGPHYRVDVAGFRPTPVQRPRIPIWACGSWPLKAPYRRAARWDGVWPMLRDEGPFDVSPQQVADIAAFIRKHRDSEEPFDLIQTNGNPVIDLEADARRVDDYVTAGASWWVELIYPWRFGWENRGPWPLAEMADRIRLGPPR